MTVTAHLQHMQILIGCAIHSTCTHFFLKRPAVYRQLLTLHRQPIPYIDNWLPYIDKWLAYIDNWILCVGWSYLVVIWLLYKLYLQMDADFVPSKNVKNSDKVFDNRKKSTFAKAVQRKKPVFNPGKFNHDFSWSHILNIIFTLHYNKVNK